MGWQKEAGRNQEPSGEGKIPPCKLRLSSSNPWATGPAPFLTSSERRRDSAAAKTKNEILQQKLEDGIAALFTSGKTTNELLKLSKTNSDGGSGFALVCTWCRCYCSVPRNKQALPTFLTAFDFTQVCRTIHQFRCQVARMKSITELTLLPRKLT